MEIQTIVIQEIVDKLLIRANVSPSGVMVSWLKASNENRWTVEYGETGFAQGNGTSGDNAAS